MFILNKENMDICGVSEGSRRRAISINYFKALYFDVTQDILPYYGKFINRNLLMAAITDE
jgi:DNA polymerase III delta prime subunit